MTSLKPTVFVVDDDASVRKALARLFTSVGLRVETFTGATDLFARVPAGEHGCLLLDIKMPKLTGLELQQQLVGLGIEMPVIFLSAHADVPGTVRAMKAGALEVFTKPFQDAALLEAVNQAIARDEARHRKLCDDQGLRERYATLTSRERMVMAHVVAGKLNKEAAWIMGTSEKTVKTQRARVMRKMLASSLPDLVRMADRLGLNPSDSSGSRRTQRMQ
jgi:FixJ family two-component response regulator